MVKHHEQHLAQLPHGDARSQAILEQMRADELQHATAALDAGGLRFPAPVKAGMSLLSKVMTKATYHL
ncbi:2-nonaprenyl-3-methyl-6-methoxy-1,4-benzoquinol hydroxylase [compost metagenome]